LGDKTAGTRACHGGGSARSSAVDSRRGHADVVLSSDGYASSEPGPALRVRRVHTRRGLRSRRVMRQEAGPRSHTGGDHARIP
jgi:hypothetical protein